MIVDHESNMMAVAIESPEVEKAAMKVLVGAEQGWDDYVMRIVELGPGGYSPRHSHGWPHINYMLEGRGVLEIEGSPQEVRAGSYAYVPAGAVHQFRNSGPAPFRFICIVPKEGHQ